jgi:lycopene cyclase domain-containing protein
VAVVTYWALNAIFLAVVAAVAVAAQLARRAPRWRALGLSLVALLLTTAVFDNVMISVGLVGYDSAKISGAFIGVAPLEDFAYAVAAAVLLPSLWSLFAPAAPQSHAAPKGPTDA